MKSIKEAEEEYKSKNEQKSLIIMQQYKLMRLFPSEVSAVCEGHESRNKIMPVK